MGNSFLSDTRCGISQNKRWAFKREMATALFNWLTFVDDTEPLYDETLPK